jgi:hypothetical protein
LNSLCYSRGLRLDDAGSAWNFDANASHITGSFHGDEATPPPGQPYRLMITSVALLA